MAAMAQNLGKPGDALNYMKLAMEHVDSMTERERYRDLQATSVQEGLFEDWLSFEIEVLDARIAWLDRFAERCTER